MALGTLQLASAFIVVLVAVPLVRRFILDIKTKNLKGVLALYAKDAEFMNPITRRFTAAKD
jgi:hypothetical protein